MAHSRNGAPFKVEMTDEDKRVILECYKEAFLFRCLPLITINSIGTHALYKRGLLGRPIISHVLGAIIGSYIGVISYGPVFKRKLSEQVPYSDYSRLFTGKVSYDDLYEEYRQPRKDDQGRQDEKPKSYLTELGMAEANEEILEDKERKITYEELRRKNRTQSQPPSRSQPGNEQWPINEERSRLPQKPQSFIDSKNAKSNKYGDVWDKDS